MAQVWIVAGAAVMGLIALQSMLLADNFGLYFYCGGCTSSDSITINWLRDTSLV